MASPRSRIIGRIAEQEVLRTALESPEPELVAVYGRRRVGKTFLVREALARSITFELVGVNEASMEAQLGAFARALSAAGDEQPTPSSWTEAFTQLQRFLTKGRRSARQVLFFDEVPWLATPRSGFLSAFDHFWNAWATKRRDLMIVLCGSAASWMLQHLVRARGGLYNRVTRRLRLRPFTVAETHEFLASLGASMGGYSTLELYMAMGGVPHYLKEVLRGESAARAIDRVCFSRDGLLHDEFHALYRSLFHHAERHEALVRALARKPRGQLRTELLASAGLMSGGGASALLDELEAAGFVVRAPQFGRLARDSLYRLADEYSLFFLRWIEGARGRTWTEQRRSAAWRAWSGYAYEGLWLSHADRLKRALGIEAVETVESTWQAAATGDDPGAQVDLVIDRRDGCINLCEMKFSEGEVVIDKRLAAELRARRDAFRRATGTKKTLLLTLVTTHGLRRNAWSNELIARAVTMDALFDGQPGLG